MICNYRKKPVVISACIWTGDNTEEVIKFTEGKATTLPIQTANRIFTTCSISTLEGKMDVNVGDYIIKGVNGEFYPCKPDIFKKTYEQVT